jgi:signal transduction histidine kinase
MSLEHGDPRPNQPKLDRSYLLPKDGVGMTVAGEEGTPEDPARRADEVLAMVSHELRNSVNAIATAHVLMEGMLPRDATAQRVLDLAKKNLEVIDKLLDDIDEARGRERRSPEFDVKRVDLANVVTLSTDPIRKLARDKGIRLEVNVSPSTFVVGDRARLMQVIANVVGNAVKFTPKDGAVKVTLESAKERAVVTVVDTGEGISADFLPHVFESFRQAPTRTVKEGLGLGLSIVRRIVENHHGEVHVASAGPGQGTAVTVSLPLETARG